MNVDLASLVWGITLALHTAGPRFKYWCGVWMLDLSMNLSNMNVRACIRGKLQKKINEHVILCMNVIFHS